MMRGPCSFRSVLAISTAVLVTRHHQPKVFIVLGRTAVAVKTTRHRNQVARPGLAEQTLRRDVVPSGRIRGPAKDARVHFGDSLPRLHTGTRADLDSQPRG